MQGRFKEILKRANEGSISLSELEQLQKLMEDENSAADIKMQMFSELKEDECVKEVGFKQEKLFNKIEKKINKKNADSHKKLRKLYLTTMKIAAIIVSFVLGGVAILIYESNFKEVNTNMEYCEIVTPLGSKSQVVLPDSSIVWLNAGSKLKYSNTFNKQNRNLFLEGEGYFKVAKNKKIPFRVNAYDFIVEAVGTEFNVRAYEEDATIVTSLVEGKVKLEHASEKIADNIYLNPNHKATFYKVKNQSNKKPRLIIRPNVDLSSNIAWKNNQLILNKEKLEELSIDLERMYDCKIHFNSEDVKSFMFTGTITDMSLNDILDVIKISTPVTYEVKGKNVYIKRDDQRIGKFKKY